MSSPLFVSERSGPQVRTRPLSVGCLIFPRMDQIGGVVIMSHNKKSDNPASRDQVPNYTKLRAGDISFRNSDTGSGEPALVFLHYWGGSARTWNTVIQQLSTDFRCVAYDQRGWGGSDAPPQGYSLWDLTLDARQIVQALGLRRFVLVGHSMGGKIAQLLASQQPPGLEGLVLVAPATPTRNGYVCLLGEALYTSSSPVGGWKIVMYLSISALGISNAPSGRFRFRSSKRRYNSEYGTSI